MACENLPAGFPHPNPTTPYWQLPPHPLAHHRTTQSLPTHTVDYIVVGSGLSGAAVAYKLLSRDPMLSVVMLEARTAVSGATGRNGGHCRAGWWKHFKKHVDSFGEDEAVKFENLEQQNIVDIVDFVRDHGVECDFCDVESADIYTTTKAWAEVLEAMQLRENVGKRRPDLVPPVERQVWHGQRANERLGLPEDVVGAVTYRAYTQNPYLLVCKMLELSLEKGLNLQTETPALKVEPVTASDSEAARWSVSTERGAVRARQVVLATNAYTNALHGGLAKTEFLVPSRAQITAVKSKRKFFNHPVLCESGSINDRGSGDYFVVRGSKVNEGYDIVYGGGRYISKTSVIGTTDDSIFNEEIATYLKRATSEYFKSNKLEDNSEEFRDWTGIICQTPDTFPLVGPVPQEDGLWAIVGMNGHGMAMAFRCAEALVITLMTGQEPDWMPKSFRIARAWMGKNKSKEKIETDVSARPATTY